MKNKSIGSNWDDVRRKIFTDEEINYIIEELI